jgi:hypothetical protein
MHNHFVDQCLNFGGRSVLYKMAMGVTFTAPSVAAIILHHDTATVYFVVGVRINNYIDSCITIKIVIY